MDDAAAKCEKLEKELQERHNIEAERTGQATNNA